MVLVTPRVEAATKTWNSASDQLWQTAANWSTPGAPGASDTALFNGSVAPPSGTVAIALKNGQSTTLQAITLTLASGNLALGNSETTGNNNTNHLVLTGTMIDSVANTVLANLTGEASLLTIQDSVLGGSKSMNLSLTSATNVIQASANNNIAINSVITGSSTSLTFQGGGTLALSRDNTFTGALSIADGTLRIATINNAGTAGVLGNSTTAVTLGSSGKTGTLEYTGATTSSNKAFALAAGGTGDFRVGTAGTGLTLSGIISGSGAFRKTGVGTLILSAANTYMGALSVQEGTLQIATINNAGTNGVLGNSSSAVTLGSTDTTGTLRYTGTSAASNRWFTMATGGGLFDITNTTTSLTLSGNIDGNGSLTKAGAGTLILTGTVSQSGGTTVTDGKLVVDGNHIGDLTVENGSLLRGKGAIDGKLFVDTGGTVSPGNSTGIMYTGDFETAFGAHINIELGGTVAGYNTNGTDGYDQIAANGAIFLGAGTVINLTLVNAYDPALNTSFNILTATGGFGNTDISSLLFDVPILADGYSYVARFAEVGGVTALQLSVIPEPDTWAMFTGGLGVLIYWSTRRRRRFRS